VEHSSSLEANSSSATQEITRILYKPKVRKRVHNSQPFVPILGHPFHASITYFLRDPLILSPSLRLVLSSALFPSSFPTKTRYAPLFPPTCPMPSPSIFFFNFITKWYLVMGPDYVVQMVRVSISLVYWKQCLDKGKLTPLHDVKIYGGVEEKLHKFLTSALCDGMWSVPIRLLKLRQTNSLNISFAKIPLIRHTISDVDSR